MSKLSQHRVSKKKLVVAYFLIYVVWGSTYFFIDVALKEFPVFLLGALRFLLAGVLLVGICYLKKIPVGSPALIKSSAISGIVLLFIDMAVIMFAEQFVSSSLVAIMASSTAIWITLLDFPMWKKKLYTKATLVKLSIGFIGVVLLYAQQLLTEQQDRQYSTGIFILIFGCISWALGTLYTKYKGTSCKDSCAHHPFAGAAWQMFFAGMVFAICSVVKQEPFLISWQAISWGSWAALGYLILCGSVLAFTAYIWLLQKRSANEVGTHAYVNPIIAILLGTVLGAEKVTGWQIVGLLLILTGVYLIQKQKQSN